MNQRENETAHSAHTERLREEIGAGIERRNGANQCHVRPSPCAVFANNRVCAGSNRKHVNKPFKKVALIAALALGLAVSGVKAYRSSRRVNQIHEKREKASGIRSLLRGRRRRRPSNARHVARPRLRPPTPLAPTQSFHFRICLNNFKIRLTNTTVPAPAMFGFAVCPAPPSNQTIISIRIR